MYINPSDRHMIEAIKIVYTWIGLNKQATTLSGPVMNVKYAGRLYRNIIDYYHLRKQNVSVKIESMSIFLVGS